MRQKRSDMFKKLPRERWSGANSVYQSMHYPHELLPYGHQTGVGPAAAPGTAGQKAHRPRNHATEAAGRQAICAQAPGRQAASNVYQQGRSRDELYAQGQQQALERDQIKSRKDRDMNTSIRLLLGATCAACFISAAIASADAKSAYDRGAIRPRGTAQPVSSPTVREHSGGPPPRSTGTVSCGGFHGGCFQHRNGYRVQVYPIKRDHRAR